MVELVVARYQEDIAWVRNVPESVRATVYNKGLPLAPDWRGVIVLPNIGREAHTYLYHIINHYDSLADLTVFTQGKPFDHAPDLHKVLRAAANGELEVGDFKWLGFLVDTDDKRGRRLFVPWSKNPSREELPLDEFYRELFGGESPESFRFYGGAQFVVSAACVRRRPREFYQRALDLAESWPLAAHCLERLWDRVFGVSGVTDELMNGRDTVYLKQIKDKQPYGY
ncbi:MAG: DUF3431 domain-containing protein [Verrucomicrobiales bacterium]|jgi:hypothetical protein|nr:DUF3431 domain-containing protein [Verrucomicrobiales bacterium]